MTRSAESKRPLSLSSLPSLPSLPSLSMPPSLSTSSVLYTALLLLGSLLAYHGAGPLAHRACADRTAAGWHDTAISTASQGKLWKPQASRTFSRSLRFQKQVARGGEQTAHDDLPKIGPTCERWSVVTTIFEPTKLLLQLRALPGWCLVVVGDRKTNDTAWDAFVKEAPLTSVYLSADAQERLPYRVLRHVPWNHFGRKNIGYLYAVHHGAQVMWDTDDDNDLQQPSEVDMLVDIANGPNINVPLADANHHVWNPYPVYAPTAAVSGNPVSTAWPRGLPLPYVKDAAAAATCAAPRTHCNTSTMLPASQIGVYQSLADNDPDVDAMYRLTAPIPLSFPRPHAGPRAIALPRLRVAPFNAQATLWTRQAMWALLLPVTVHGRVSDIWRSYFSQRMFADVGLHVAFTTPVAIQFRNIHSLVADLQAEVPLYTQADELVKWLAAWHFGGTEDIAHQLESRFEKLLADLFSIGIVEEDDVLLMQAWLDDLRSVGYEMPSLAEGFADMPAVSMPEPDRSDVARVASCIRISDSGDLRAARDGVKRRDGDASVDVFLLTTGVASADVCEGMAAVSDHCQTVAISSTTVVGALHKLCADAVDARAAEFGRYDWVTSDLVGDGAADLPPRLQLVMRAERPTVWRYDQGRVATGRADWLLQAIRQPMGLDAMEGPVQVGMPPASSSDDVNDSQIEL